MSKVTTSTPSDWIPKTGKKPKPDYADDPNFRRQGYKGAKLDYSKGMWVPTGGTQGKRAK